jgi:hypothetical protein
MKMPAIFVALMHGIRQLKCKSCMPLAAIIGLPALHSGSLGTASSSLERDRVTVLNYRIKM